MKQPSSGFTLVELAITLTLIGLLIAGVLRGQEMLLNGQVTTTIAQIGSYRAALTTFKDSYRAMPGDMSDASLRIPGCDVTCDMNPNSVATGGAFGRPDDGFIGMTPWQMWRDQSHPLSTTTAQSGPENETQMFWLILLKANMISGITDIALRQPTTPRWDVTHPSAKVGGGFLVGESSPAMRLAGQSVGAAPRGLILGLAAVIDAQAAPPIAGIAITTRDRNPLTPARAAQIDRKLDDGFANTGKVQAFGPEGTSPEDGCFSTSGQLATYSEANGSYDCGIVVTMQSGH